jgi:hypothetical protein
LGLVVHEIQRDFEHIFVFWNEGNIGMSILPDVKRQKDAERI